MDGAFEGKKNTDKWFPIRLVDSGDLYTPETGIAFGSVTVKYGYEAATTESTYTVTTNDWKEQGDGNYWLNIGASEFTSEGKYIVKVEATGCHDYSFVVEARDKTVAELINDVASILDDTGTSGVIVATNNDKTGYSISGTKNTLDDLNDPSTASIADATMNKVVDGSIDVEECLKVLLAVLAGDMAKSSNTYTYKDQSGATKVTEVVSESAVERTIGA